VVPCDRPAGTEIVQNANSHNAYETSPATPAALTYECWIHIRIHTHTHTHGMRARLQEDPCGGRRTHAGAVTEGTREGWRGGGRERVVQVRPLFSPPPPSRHRRCAKAHF
jgi:hypothetical protein